MSSTRRHISLFLVVLVTAPAIGACGRDALSREKAGKLIAGAERYPYNLLGDLTVQVETGGPNWHNVPYWVSHFDRLKAEGLLDYERVNIDHRIYTVRFTARLTPMGDQYRVGEVQQEGGKQTIQVRTAVVEMGDILGIVERTPSAEVTYTKKVGDITPFGRFLNVVEETRTQTVTLTKFDDGWRVDQ